MAFSSAVYGVISEIGERLYQRQDKKREKANTLVVGIGTGISALLGAGTYLLESDVEGLPVWLPIAVMLLGMIGTAFGVSRTKNGITRSTLEQINAEISSMVDAQEGPATRPHVPEPVPPTTGDPTPDGGTTSTGAIADDLDGLAKRIAGRHHQA